MRLCSSPTDTNDEALFSPLIPTVGHYSSSPLIPTMGHTIPPTD
ncbi:unnamed protein product [Staurois parvus]|uniref:Uncharacterized protein n=1 Tax=Staurois parvus TaxID=386267 RepID=A0ABN9DAG7_9NEOB|nr:unnamed protein product [Staurois parvus]